MVEELTRSYFWMGYIILSLTVFLIVGAIFLDTAHGGVANKESLSKEMSLLLSSILTSNADLKVEYSVANTEETQDLIITEECEVRVSDKGESLYYQNDFCLNNVDIQKGDIKIELRDLRFNLKEGILTLEEI